MTAPVLAGFWRRLAAVTYDTLILAALLMVAAALATLVVELLWPGLSSRDPDALRHHPLYGIWLALWWAGYYSWCWRKGGQTVGMKAWRLRLVSTLTGRLYNWQIAVRLGVSVFVGALLLALYSVLSQLGLSQAGLISGLPLLLLQVPVLAIQERFSQTLTQVVAKPAPPAA